VLIYKQLKINNHENRNEKNPGLGTAGERNDGAERRGVTVLPATMLSRSLFFYNLNF
jgi:hypothetical protein